MAPETPISAAAVSSSVALYLHKAGIQVRRAGSHTLRHTCVQRLIDAEFPLKTIGDYVGHRSPESTRIYSKVAIASLREVALGDGEDYELSRSREFSGALPDPVCARRAINGEVARFGPKRPNC